MNCRLSSHTKYGPRSNKHSIHDPSLYLGRPDLLCAVVEILRDRRGVHRIWYSFHYLFMYLFICICGVKSTLIQLSKQKSYSDTRKENNCRFPSRNNNPLFLWWPHYTPSRSLSSLIRLLTSFTQFRYLLLNVFPFKAVCMQPLLLITDGFSKVRWQFKFKTDGTELPATNAFSVAPAMFGYTSNDWQRLNGSRVTGYWKYTRG